MPRLARPRKRAATPIVACAASRASLPVCASLIRAASASMRVFAAIVAVLSTAACLALVSPAFASGRGEFVRGKVVVGYAPRREDALEARASATGGAVGGDAKTKVLKLRDGEAVSTAIRRLRKRRGVRFVVPDYVAHAASVGYMPNDPGKSGQPGGWHEVQWNFDGTYGVEAPLAWEHLIDDGAPGGAGTIVAVLDTGVAYENYGGYERSPDFEADQFVKGYDFVAKTSHPDDENGHGTFVAGTIAEATNNGIDLTGLAYGTKIMPVRVLDAEGEGEASTIAEGVRFAVNHGAQVINMSLVFPASITASEIPELTSALAYAHERGVTVVAAAGNKDSTDVPYPARDKFVIAVGATTEYGCLAKYSNYGPQIDIVAPGGGPNALLPEDANCRARNSGRDVFQETFLGPSPTVFGLPGGYKGTSMATPDVSATAALVIASGVLGAHPTPAAIRYRLEQTARPLGGPDEADYGHGLLDAATATAPGGPGAVSAASARTGARTSRDRKTHK